MLGGAIIDKADATKENLLTCAKAEFLEKGFRDASVRNIASAAGLTTGSIYRYFADKDALFSSVTQPAADALMQSFTSMSNESYDSLERQGTTYTKEQSMENLTAIFDIIYGYFDEFYLLTVQAEGSSSAGFWDELVEYEVAGTLSYVQAIKQKFNSNYEMDEATMHIISEAYFNALLEPVRHRMDKDAAIKHLTVLGSFFADGWKGIEDKIKQS